VKMTPWPLKGWRPMSAGVNGNEAGEVEGAFSMWAEGGLLFGRNEAVKRAYIIGWYDDPAIARRDREPRSRDCLYIYQANYHPDGGQIDIRAELPTHFADSLRQLGFEEMLGNNMPLDKPPPPSREVKKQQARQHAKGVRKARRGERRGRGEREDAPKPKR